MSWYVCACVHMCQRMCDYVYEHCRVRFSHHSVTTIASWQDCLMHECVPGGGHSVLHQHADRHWTHSSWNWSDEACLLLHSCTKTHRSQSYHRTRTATFVWPICVLSDTTCSESILCMSVIDCYKYWQTIGMFQLLTVLTTVNTWLTRWPQIRCLIHGHRYCCSVLAQSSLDGKKRERGSIQMSSPSKSTSPMSRTFPVFGSWMRLMPTSMTAAPSFTMSAVIRPGIPAQQGHVSAIESISFKLCSDIKKKSKINLVLIQWISCFSAVKFY